MKLAGKAAVGFYLLLVFLAFNKVNGQIGRASSQAPLKSGTERRVNSIESRSILNINNAWLRLESSGIVGPMTYPMQFGELLFSDHLIWVGKVKDGRSPQVRTGGGMYSQYRGTAAGAILSKGVAENPSSPDVRVYRIRPDYLTDDLRLDAAGYFDTTPAKVTPEMIDLVRSQYIKDWKEWPWQKGAPFDDRNMNGKMDSDEMPGIQHADQVVWFSYNDLDDAVSRSFYGAPSTGLEFQVTLWAYKDDPLLKNVIFERYRIIYKGTSTSPPNSVINDMYICQFVDTDVGYFADDLAGCDSSLSLAFGYSSTNPDRAFKSVMWQNPGVGYLLLQGPIVPATSNHEALIDFKTRVGFKNLPMSSYFLHATGTGTSNPPHGIFTYYFWNMVRGFYPDRSRITTWPILNPTGESTRFMVGGDPVAGTGWVDGSFGYWTSVAKGWGYNVIPGERYFWMNTGPLTMALGDTQEVVFAIVAGLGSDGRQSVAVVKQQSKLIRAIYPNLAERAAEIQNQLKEITVSLPRDFLLSQNYPNPFNPNTRIEYALPIDSEVHLSIVDVLGKNIRVLDVGFRPAGTYRLTWDGKDRDNELVPSGVYFYRLSAGSVNLTRKMMLVR